MRTINDELTKKKQNRMLNGVQRIKGLSEPFICS